METKVCSNCKIEKSLDDFLWKNKSKGHKHARCIVCYKEIRKKNYEKNKSYYLKKNVRLKKQNKEWYENNKEKHRENNRNWREKNIERVREYHNNLIKYQRKTDPIKQLIFNVRNRISSVLKNKTKSSFDIVGCPPIFLKEHLEKQFTKGMCWENHGLYGWHIDHIIPLSTAKTDDEVYSLCHYTNLQPLWAEDNLKKGVKILS